MVDKMRNWGTEQSNKLLKVRQSQGQKAHHLCIHLAPWILGHAIFPRDTHLIPNQSWATACGYGHLTSNTKQFLILENYAALSSYNALDKKIIHQLQLPSDKSAARDLKIRSSNKFYSKHFPQ